MRPGYCRWCSNPSSDSDVCGRCEDESDRSEGRPRRTTVAPLSSVHVPYDPEVDPF